MNHIPIYRCALVREGTFKYEIRTALKPCDAARIFTEYLAEADREHFVMLGLTTRGKVIGLHTVFIGALDRAIACPAEVFKAALLMNASQIIIAHNHPSGDPTPSPQDITSAQRMMAAGQLLGVAVIDAMIIGEGRWVSLRETGAIQ